MGRSNQSSKKREKRDSGKRTKKKVSILDTEGITYVDYKDVELLKKFVSERGKIRARRVTGNTAQQQREVANAVKIARELALLPYTVRIATGAKGGRKRRRDDEDRPMRDDAEFGTGDIPPPPTGADSAPGGGGTPTPVAEDAPEAPADAVADDAGDAGSDEEAS